MKRPEEDLAHSTAELLNLDILAQLMRTLFASAAVRISILDQKGATISAPQLGRRWCSYINDDTEKHSKCSRGTQYAVEIARRTLEPYQYRCHMGFAATIVPVVVEREAIAYLLVSGYQMGPACMEGLPLVMPLSDEALEKDDLAQHTDIAQFSQARLEEIIQLLTVTSNYMTQVGRYTKLLLDMQSRSIDVLTRARIQAEEEKQVWKNRLQILSFSDRQSFLYDTLNVIALTAEEERAPRSVRLTQLLAEHMRRGDRGKTTSTLGEETAWLERYFELLRCLYQGRFDLHTEIEPVEDPELVVPQLPIATLVDVGLRRLEGCQGKKGCFRFQVRPRQDGVELSVTDNGPVISAALLKRFHRLQPVEDHGLQLLAHTVRELTGELDSRFYWSLTSSPERGTTMTLFLPAQEDLI